MSCAPLRLVTPSHRVATRGEDTSDGADDLDAVAAHAPLVSLRTARDASFGLGCNSALDHLDLACERKRVGEIVFGRERMMMAFVARAPTTVTKLKLVKWLFVAATEFNAAAEVPFYDFLPYQYGPFSFTAYHELDRVTKLGFLSLGPSSVTVSAKRRVDDAVGKLSRAASNLVDEVLRDYGNLGGSALISRIYGKHPWFASRSKLRPAVEQPKSSLAVYTCGYEGESIDAFLNRLLSRGIKRVIDVRKNAYSRKYGFTGGVFKGLCKKVGIDYAHVPQLGVPSAMRTDLTVPGAREKLFEHYRARIVPEHEQAQRHVAALTEERPSALLCFEANARDCHRGSLAPFIATQTGLEIVHI